MRPARTRLPTRRVWRRRQRSMKGPVKGPEHDDQGGGDAGGRGHVLGGEEEHGGQARLDHAVAGLGDEADAEQGAEGRDSGEILEVSGQAHGARLTHLFEGGLSGAV